MRIMGKTFPTVGTLSGGAKSLDEVGVLMADVIELEKPAMAPVMVATPTSVACGVSHSAHVSIGGCEHTSQP
jgi:hypothetical protein